MRTVAVLPVKSFARAKQRIEDALAAEDRRVLAEAMVGDVLEALGRIHGLDGTLMITAEPLARSMGEASGARVVHDPREAGQSHAAQVGVDSAIAAGAERVLLVPGDCPALDHVEVSDLLAAHGGGEVVIVPDRHGHGTNALLVAPPDALRPSFGPGSFARHAALARASGATVRVAALPSLGLDVDTPGDLAALRAALSARPDAAGRTRAVLDRLMPDVTASR